MRWIVDWQGRSQLRINHVLVADAEGNVVRINERAQDFWGVRRQQVGGQHWTNVIRATNDPVWLSRLHAAAIAGRMGNVRVACRDGRHRDLIVDLRLWPTTWMGKRAVLFLVERVALAEAEPSFAPVTALARTA